MNDYLVVTMAGDGVEPIQDVPVELLGLFRIDHRYEDGYVVRLSAMEGEKFFGPKMISLSIRPLLLATALLFAAGCGRHDHDHAEAATKGHGHEHHAPHGGTPVVLGDDAYHLELVLDGERGALRAYILDGHMENFIRSAASSFEVIAKVAGENRPLIFMPVGNSATGETPGDTACFEATAEWLRTATAFDGVLTSLSIRGSSFDAVAFRFPEGNEAH